MSATEVRGEGEAGMADRVRVLWLTRGTAGERAAWGVSMGVSPGLRKHTADKNAT